MINISLRSKPGFSAILLRSLVVGVAYALASTLIAAILGSLSRLTPTFENFSIWLMTGTLVSLSLSPFILNSNESRQKTILAVWAVLAFVRSLGLGIEGSLFKPTQALPAVVGAVFGILISLLVAWLAVALLLPEDQEIIKRVDPERSLWGWIWRVLVVGLAYFVFYFVFGATNALLYTLAFYKNNPQYGLSLPPTSIIFLAQLMRGPLFGLGSLFIVNAVDLPRRQCAVYLGLLLFVVGGLGPYLEITFRTMPLGFNLATLTEVFFQNFLTGIVAANLLGQKSILKNAV